MSDVIETTDAGAAAADVPEALDGQALLDSIAGEMGWSPKEKWKGDPEKWRDATTFLKATPAVLKSTREQMERSARVASQAIERAQRQAIADAEDRVAAAAEAGDKEAIKEAAKDLREASKAPDPGFQDFVARNPWFTDHEEARALAIAAAEKSFKLGGTDREQRTAGEAEVRKRFPELFDDGAAEAIVQRQAPAVAGGQRAASPAPRKRGWSDMPQAAREAQTRHFVKKGLLTETECAESYWSENA